MSDLAEAPVDARPPRAGEALALVVIVPAVAGAARALSTTGLTTPQQSALIAAVAAGLVGLPALAWLFERGRLSIGALAGAGALAGLIPPVLFAISGAVGLVFLGGFEYAQWALGKGASIPLYGSISWGRYLLLVFWSVSVGAASGAIYGLLVPGQRWRRPTAWVFVALVVAVMVGLGRVTG